MISKHLDKNNLHHAYLIEGEREQIVVEILEFLKSVGVESTGNADVTHITLDSFKIDDARNLKSFAGEKGFSAGKKFFIVSTNNFLLEAQNTLLKMFEEPIENTHFFVVVPDASSLLKTFVSRFFLISHKSDFGPGSKNAEDFLKMSLQARLDFLKNFLAIPEEDEEDLSAESARTKALKFLNALESALQAMMSKVPFDISCFHHIFKVREFLRMPGSSPKTLMESVAIVIPNF